MSTNARTMAVMAANGGLITTAQAYDCGLSASSIRGLVRLGAWVVVRRGVYVDGEHWRALDDHRGRHRIRTRAASMTMRRAHVASHDSAGHEHGLDMLAPPEAFVHVTRPGMTNAFVKHGIKVHLAPYTSEQVVTVDGLACHDLARAAVDIAREHGSPYGEVACDGAMRMGVSRLELMAACEPMRSWRHVTRVRAAVEYADPRAASVIETLGRMLVDELGVGETDLQFPVRLLNGRVAWGDIRVGCHIFETDGKVKLVPVEDGGFATRSPTELAWARQKRDRDLRDVGLGASHIIYADFWPPARAAAITRLRAEYADTVARFGEVLPERLRLQAIELRGERGA